ncbi:MAG TPA: hypothetical protein VD978_22235 [Azospirillum sp.]|nr:hypothetical protein [Azospirillum sp.]
MRETAAAGHPDLAWAEMMSKPQFQLVSRPFHALHVWRDVTQRGVRYEIPKVEAPQDRRSLQMPEARWIALPPNERFLHPLYDQLTTLYSFDQPVVSRETCVEHQEDETFSVDPEACAFVFDFEADRLLRTYHDPGLHDPCIAVQFYLRFGVIALASGRLEELANTVDHAQRLRDAGLGPGSAIDELLSRSISDEEHTALRASMKSADVVSLPTPRQQATQCDLFAYAAKAA